MGGSNGACSTLHRFLVTPSATHNQIGPLWCWFPSGWACARSRPLWVSPRTSPVRLGVSPAATPIPTGVFNQRFEALFCPAGALGCVVYFAPLLFVPVYLCTNVGPQGATRRSACPVLCHSESGPLGLAVHECRAAVSSPVCPTLCQSRSCHGNVSPLRPGCPSPPLLPVWVNVYFLSTWCRTSLPLDYLSVLVVRVGAVCLPTPPSWFYFHYAFTVFAVDVPLLDVSCFSSSSSELAPSTVSSLL